MRPTAQVRSRQEKAAQRMYQGLDRKMMAVRDVSPEPTPSVTNGMLCRSLCGCLVDLSRH